MTSEDGSFCFMADIQSWPPLETYEMGRAESGDTICCFVGHPDGSIEMTVYKQDKASIQWRSQRIALQNPGMRIILGCWGKEPEPAILVTGNRLLPFDPDLPPRDVRAKRAEGESEGRAKITQLLDEIPPSRDWRLWRKVHFASPEFIPKENLRLRPQREQERDLEKAVGLLEGLLCCSFEIGSPAIAAILRSLVYVREKPNRNLDALLLRIAAFKDLDLKIHAYRLSASILETLPLPGEGVFVFPNFPQLQPLPGNSVEMDLQEWLDAPLCRVRSTTGPKAIDRSVAAKDLIFTAANKLGISHFDRSIPPELDSLAGVSVAQVNGLDAFLNAVALCVVQLGKSALSR